MNKHVCVHGHFYQPPRENPWLESIEPQDSAAPYHDWNARISAECYEPNTASRILDDKERIISIQNNYSRMSFNFGPTLLSWMERCEPSVYDSILAADRESQDRFGGHGSALAQAYNHTILPLATNDEKELQISWGIRDFQHRFGREPEGMWLPETAVDLASLDALAAHGIRFTVLAPSQAARVRSVGDNRWTDVSGARIDPSRPYLQHLPSGRSISIFFYDGALARGVAFEGLLHRGEYLADRIVGSIPDDGPHLAHIATDGESYGHHHAHGDMALAYALHAIESRGLAKITNYGEFLERFPPAHEVEIYEDSSWSCAHGVERWRSDCGCHTGGPAGWNQSWRAPLRDALDWLRDSVRPLRDEVPEGAVTGYIDIILNRTRDAVARFLEDHDFQPRHGSLTGEDRVRALKVLELQRQLQLMYTSCGWFFNDLSGIETVQVLQYAGRAVQLAEDLSGDSIEDAFLSRLATARSNHPARGSGRDIYEKCVKPAKVTWEMLGAHYAISSVFERYPKRATLYCYEIERKNFDTQQSSKTKLAFGCARLTSQITRASEDVSFAVLNLGNHAITAGVRRGCEKYDDFSRIAPRARENELPRLMQDHFGDRTFDLRSLFGDEQRRIVDRLLRATLDDAEALHRRVFERHGETMRFLAELGVPSPPALSVAAEVVLNGNLREALARDPIDKDEVGSLLLEAILEDVELDEPSIAFTARQCVEAKATQFFQKPEELELLHALRQVVDVVCSLPFEVDMWRVQNLYFRYLSKTLPERVVPAAWRQAFDALGERLSIRLPDA